MYKAQYMFTTAKYNQEMAALLLIFCMHYVLSDTSVNDTIEPFHSYMVHTSTVQWLVPS